jgi:hypothetical protein
MWTAILSIILFIALAGAMVGLFFYFNKRMNTVEDNVNVTDENDRKMNNDISSNYTKLMASQSNLQIEMIKGQSDDSIRFDSLRGSYSNMGVGLCNLRNDVTHSNEVIMGYLGWFANDLIDYVDSTTQYFSTSNLNVNGFVLMSDTSNNLSIGNANQTLGINMMDNMVNFSNMKSYNANFDNAQIGNELQVANGINLNQSGKLNFAAVDSSYTMDVDRANNLRLSMALGSNADFGIFSQLTNQSPEKVHSFDSLGNSSHAGNIKMKVSKCIVMNDGPAADSNQGKLCYNSTVSGGMDIYGGNVNSLTREVNVWDNINVNNSIRGSNVTIDNINIGNMNITASNGQLVVMNSNGSRSVISTVTTV